MWLPFIAGCGWSLPLRLSSCREKYENKVVILNFTPDGAAETFLYNEHETYKGIIFAPTISTDSFLHAKNKVEIVQ